MADKYEHRNGEMEAPAVAGVYWFLGEVGGIARRGIVDVAELIERPGVASGMAWPHWMAGWANLSELMGRWWGPIVPPWRE